MGEEEALRRGTGEAAGTWRARVVGPLSLVDRLVGPNVLAHPLVFVLHPVALRRSGAQQQDRASRQRGTALEASLRQQECASRRQG